MKRMFVSDIHLGDLGSEPYKFISAVRKENPDELYMVGDIIDLWKDSLYKIQLDHQYFFSFLNNIVHNTKIVFIVGNHDDRLDPNDNYFTKIIFKDSEELLLGDKKARIIHGHEYDNFVLKYYPISRIISFIHKIFLRGFGLDLRKLRFSLSSKKSGANFKDSIGKVKEKAIGDSSEYGILIMGHTHTPEDTISNGMRYINLGDWFHFYSYVTEEDGKICQKSQLGLS